MRDIFPQIDQHYFIYCIAVQKNQFFLYTKTTLAFLNTATVFTPVLPDENYRPETNFLQNGHLFFIDRSHILYRPVTYSLQNGHLFFIDRSLILILIHCKTNNFQRQGHQELNFHERKELLLIKPQKVQTIVHHRIKEACRL